MTDPNPWTEEERALLDRTLADRSGLEAERDLYRQLLMKYLKNVYQQEGIDFLSFYTTSNHEFSDAELALIRLLSSKANPDYYKTRS